MPHEEPVDPVVGAPATAVVVIGAEPLRPAAVAAIGDLIRTSACVVIAADSGLDHALAAGITPTIVVGDFDSVSAAGLAWARAGDVVIHEHPPAKDATDTELALETAAATGATDVTLVSGGGDRLDHTIAALVALGNPVLAHCASVSAWWGESRAQVLHGPRSLSLALPIGTTFSLLALHGPCTGVAESGAAWPLVDADLAPGSGLGVSNVATEPTVTISVERGVLTVIVPQAPSLTTTPTVSSEGPS